MSIEFSIDPECGCVLTRMEGMVTGGQVMDYMERLRESPGYSPAFPRLVDVRRVDDMLSASEIRSIAEAVRANPDFRGGKRALVAETDLVFGMLRMFELLTSQCGARYRAFRGIREATEWLGADCPAYRELTQEPAPVPQAAG